MNNRTRKNNKQSQDSPHSLLGTSTPFTASNAISATISHPQETSADDFQQHFEAVLDGLVMDELDDGFGGGDGYISGNFGDQDLGRMFLAYKQLDARVSRLEAQVFPPTIRPRSSGMKREYSSMTASTSNPPSSPGSSTSTIDPSVFDRSVMVSHLKELKRTDLDTYCLPLLQVNPKPEKEDLQVIARQLEQFYPQFRFKDLLSKIREWFRKRREYMSQRIFAMCEQAFPSGSLTSDERLRECLDEVNQEGSRVLKKIVFDSQLEITDEAAAQAYCREKVVSYLTNAYREHVKVRNAYVS